MKVYIGAKIIMAEPMDRDHFMDMKGVFGTADKSPGYKVTYPDGYVSWSPKATFEEAYREVSDKEKELLK